MDWTGGLCVATLKGIQWMARNTEINFCLRLDTDSLVINEFVESVNKKFKKTLALDFSVHTLSDLTAKSENHTI
jgi:hypothetical protein